MINMDRNTFGIKSEPPIGIIFKDSEEGVMLFSTLTLYL